MLRREGRSPHRHNGLPRGWEYRRGTHAQRGHGDVPRQRARPRQLPDVHAGDESQPPGDAGVGERPQPRLGARRAARALSARHGCHAKLLAGDRPGLAHAAQDSLRRYRGVFGALDAREQESELVATHARHGVALADRLAQLTGDFLKELVAARMPNRVVDELESVEVKEHDCHFFAPPARLRQADTQTLLEEHAIRQPGQHVVVREMADRLFGLLTLTDIADEGAKADGITAVQRHHGQLDRELAAGAVEGGYSVRVFSTRASPDWINCRIPRYQ